MTSDSHPHKETLQFGPDDDLKRTEIGPSPLSSDITESVIIAKDEASPPIAKKSNKKSRIWLLGITILIIIIVLVIFLPTFFYVTVPSLVKKGMEETKITLDLSQTHINNLYIPSLQSQSDGRRLSTDDVMTIDLTVGLKAEKNSWGAKNFTVNTSPAELDITQNGRIMGQLDMPAMTIEKGNKSVTEGIRVLLSITDEIFIQNMIDSLLEDDENVTKNAVTISGSLDITVIGIKVKDVSFSFSPDLNEMSKGLDQYLPFDKLPKIPEDDIISSSGDWFTLPASESNMICLSLINAETTINKVLDDLRDISLDENIIIQAKIESRVAPLFSENIGDMSLGAISFGVLWLPEDDYPDASSMDQLLATCTIQNLKLSATTVANSQVDCEITISSSTRGAVEAFLSAYASLSGFEHDSFYLYFIGLGSSYAPIRNAVKSFGFRTDVLGIKEPVSITNGTEKSIQQCGGLLPSNISWTSIIMPHISFNAGDGVEIIDEPQEEWTVGYSPQADDVTKTGSLISLDAKVSSKTLQNGFHRFGFYGTEVLAILNGSISPRGIIFPSPISRFVFSIVPVDEDTATYIASLDISSYDGVTDPSTSTTSASYLIEILAEIIYSNILVQNAQDKCLDSNPSQPTFHHYANNCTDTQLGIIFNGSIQMKYEKNAAMKSVELPSFNMNFTMEQFATFLTSNLDILTDNPESLLPKFELSKFYIAGSTPKTPYNGPEPSILYNLLDGELIDINDYALTPRDLLSEDYYLTGLVKTTGDSLWRGSLPHGLFHLIMMHQSNPSSSSPSDAFLTTRAPTSPTSSNSNDIINLGSIFVAPLTTMNGKEMSWRLKISPRYLTSFNGSSSKIHPLSYAFLKWWLDDTSHFGLITAYNGLPSLQELPDSPFNYLNVENLKEQYLSILQPSINDQICVNRDVWMSSFEGDRYLKDEPLDVATALTDLGFPIDNVDASSSLMSAMCPVDRTSLYPNLLPLPSSWLNETINSMGLLRSGIFPLDSIVKLNSLQVEMPVTINNIKPTKLYLYLIDPNQTEEYRFDKCDHEPNMIRLDMEVTFSIASLIGPLPLDTIKYGEGHFWASIESDEEVEWKKMCKMDMTTRSQAVETLLSCMIHSGSDCAEDVTEELKTIMGDLSVENAPMSLTENLPNGGSMEVRLMSTKLSTSRNSEWTESGDSWTMENVTMSLTCLVHFDSFESEREWSTTLSSNHTISGLLSGETAFAPNLPSPSGDDESTYLPLILPPTQFNAPWNLENGPLIRTVGTVTPTVVSVNVLDDLENSTNGLSVSMVSHLTMNIKSEYLQTDDIDACINLGKIGVVIAGTNYPESELLPLMELQPLEDNIELCTEMFYENNPDSLQLPITFVGTMSLYTNSQEATDLYTSLITSLVDATMGSTASAIDDVYFETMIVLKDEQSTQIKLTPDLNLNENSKTVLINSLNSKWDATAMIPYMLWPMLQRAEPIHIKLADLQDPSLPAPDLISNVEMDRYSMRFGDQTDECPSGVWVLGAATTARIIAPSRGKISLKTKTRLTQLSGTVHLIEIESQEPIAHFDISQGVISGRFHDAEDGFYEEVDISFPELCAGFENPDETERFQKMIASTVSGNHESSSSRTALIGDIVADVMILSLNEIVVHLPNLPQIELDEELVLPTVPLDNILSGDGIEWTSESWLTAPKGTDAELTFDQVEMLLGPINASEDSLKSLTIDQLAYEINYLPNDVTLIGLETISKELAKIVGEDYDPIKAFNIGVFTIPYFTLDMTIDEKQSFSSKFTLTSSMYNANMKTPRGMEYLLGSGRMISSFIQAKIDESLGLEPTVESNGLYDIYPLVNQLPWPLTGSVDLLSFQMELGSNDQRYQIPEVKFTVSPDIRTVACLIDQELRTQIEGIPVISFLADLNAAEGCNAIQLFIDIENPWNDTLPMKIENIYIKDLHLDIQETPNSRIGLFELNGRDSAEAVSETAIATAYQQFLKNYGNAQLTELANDLEKSNEIYKMMAPQRVETTGRRILPVATDRTAWIPAISDKDGYPSDLLLQFPSTIQATALLTYGDIPAELILTPGAFESSSDTKGFPFILPIESAIGLSAVITEDGVEPTRIGDITSAIGDLVALITGEDNKVVSDVIITLRVGDYPTSVRIKYSMNLKEAFASVTGQQTLSSLGNLFESGLGAVSNLFGNRRNTTTAESGLGGLLGGLFGN